MLNITLQQTSCNFWLDINSLLVDNGT